MSLMLRHSDLLSDKGRPGSSSMKPSPCTVMPADHLDQIIQLVAKVFSVPFAGVSILGTDYNWTMAAVG